MVDIWIDCWHISIRFILVNQFFFWNLDFINVSLWTLFPLNFGWLNFNVFDWFSLFEFVCLGSLYHGIFGLKVFLLLKYCLFAVLFFYILLCPFFVQFWCIQFGFVEETFHTWFLIEFFLVWFLLLNLCHDLI